MKLKNKVAVITGAASGIGHEIAKVYAKEGAKVVIADLTIDGAASDKSLNDLDAPPEGTLDAQERSHYECCIHAAMEHFGIKENQGS